MFGVNFDKASSNGAFAKGRQREDGRKWQTLRDGIGLL